MMLRPARESPSGACSILGFVPGPSMTDWKAVALALGIKTPENDIERTLAPLASLETAFGRATASLETGVEPAVVFDPAPEETAG